ncbi:hypothetical protein Lal_00018494 [Lupinus albus]|nr:hypothetical protein Lal_00018494 [Lupinus albus]
MKKVMETNLSLTLTKHKLRLLILAHLDVKEQRLNERIDSMNYRIMTEFHRQEEISRNQFEQPTSFLRKQFERCGFLQPPPDV